MAHSGDQPFVYIGSVDEHGHPVWLQQRENALEKAASSRRVGLGDPAASDARVVAIAQGVARENDISLALHQRPPCTDVAAQPGAVCLNELDSWPAFSLDLWRWSSTTKKTQ